MSRYFYCVTVTIDYPVTILYIRHEARTDPVWGHTEHAQKEAGMALLTVVDMEKDSQVSRHTWRAWIREGKLPVIRIGRRVRVTEEDYRRFLAENRIPARDGDGK